MPKLTTKPNEYPSIHEADWLPVTIINPDMKKGPWIAGGAVLSWYKNEPVGINKDIDVFCRNEAQAKRVINNIKSAFNLPTVWDDSNIFTTNNATTMKVTSNNTSHKVQVITCKYFSSLDDVLASFDITVCQIGTTGYEWVLGEHTAKDIRQRNLRFNYIAEPAVKRLTKYWIYGYIPVEGTIEMIQKSEIACLHDFSNDEEYSNVF